MSIHEPSEAESTFQGSKLIDNIYFVATAKQLAQNSKLIIDPKAYRKPIDTESYNLALKFISQYLSSHKFNLALDVASKESNNSVKLITQKAFVNKRLKLSTETSPVVQLIKAKNPPKEPKQTKSRSILKIERELVQSSDSELTEQSIVAEAIEMQQENIKSNQSSKHHKRKSKKRALENVDTGDTFTEESEVFVLPLHDPAYGLPKEQQKKMVKSKQPQPKNVESSKNGSSKRTKSRVRKSSKHSSTNIGSEYSYTYVYTESESTPSKQSGVQLKLPTPPISETYGTGSYYSGYSYTYGSGTGSYYSQSYSKNPYSASSPLSVKSSNISSSKSSVLPPKEPSLKVYEPGLQRAEEGSLDFLQRTAKDSDESSDDDDGKEVKLSKYSAPAVEGMKAVKGNNFFDKNAIKEAQKDPRLKPSQIQKANFSEKSCASRKSVASAHISVASEKPLMPEEPEGKKSKKSSTAAKKEKVPEPQPQPEPEKEEIVEAEEEDEKDEEEEQHEEDEEEEEEEDAGEEEEAAEGEE